MSETVLFKKVFQKFWVRQNRDRSHLPCERKEYFDGVHPFFDAVQILSSEEAFWEHLKDPLYEVFQYTATLVVEQKGDKLSLKWFYRTFSRKVGKQYFSLKKSMRFVTVNLKSGNVYFGELINYQNKRNFVKKIRSNSFINDSFRTFRANLKNSISEFNVDDCSSLTNEVCRLFIDKIDGGVENLSFANRLFKFYLDKKNIKYPNNFSLYSSVIQGEFRKILKKTDYKIVDAFMVLNKIQGKKIKKVLHTVENLNVQNYKTGLKLFGSDWLNQEENLLRDILNNKIEFILDNGLANDFNRFSSPKEKKRAFSLYKSFNKDNEIDGWTLKDHFQIYVQLKRYGDTEVEWKSTDSSEFFRQEHLDWSDKLSFYKKGHYQRVYPQSFFEVIKDFKYNDENYFPVPLTNSLEYNMESSIQSNCVRGYIGQPSSIIISLRKNSELSENRLTVEYRVSKSPNLALYYIRRVQTKAKFNYEPDESWIEPLKVLDSSVELLVRNKKFETYKLTKKCANGVELESDTHFDENGSLVWSYKAIDNDPYYINFL